MNSHLCKCRKSFLEENPPSPMISRVPKSVHMILNGLLWLVRSSFCSSSTRWLHKYIPQVLPPYLRLVGQELQFWDPTGPCPVGPGHHGASMAETSCKVRTFLLGAYDWGCPTAGRSGPRCSSIYLLTYLSVHSCYSVFLPREQPHLQVGWVRTYLELQFASNILSSWEDGLAL